VIRRSPPGYAAKVSQLVVTILAEVNRLHGLAPSPVTLQDMLAHTSEGRQLLDAQTVTLEQRVLAEVALDLVGATGRACRADAVGILAAPHPSGQLSVARAAVLADMSVSHVKASKGKTAAGVVGPLVTMNMRPGVARQSIAKMEKVRCVCVHAVCECVWAPRVCVCVGVWLLDILSHAPI
jgi:hypothetical protein